MLDGKYPAQWGEGELSPALTSVRCSLLIKAVQQVPEKMRSVVYLECAHLEEYIGNSDRARYIVDKAKKELSYEWKLYLERVLIDVRAKHYDSALQLVKSSLVAHPCTGRLWALYIQLELLTSRQFARAWRVFKQAVYEVPKAGEVWCEGGRLALMARDTATARLFFERAIEFTPQYGDSFVEWLRVELLTQGPAADLSRIEHAASCAAPNYGVLWSYCKTHPSEGAVQTMHNARRVLLDLRRYELSMNLCHALNALPIELLTADERKRLIFGWL